MARKIAELSRYAVLPLLLVVLGVLAVTLRGTHFADVFPYWQTFTIYFAMIVLERIFRYARQVSQRHLIWRDLMSTALSAFFAGAAMAAVVLPVLRLFPKTFLGRRFLFALSDQIGPLWLQVPIVFLLSSFLAYWVHRWQHTSNFWWKLHGYHHSVTSLQTSNVLVSNPLEWAMRNVLIGLLLSIVGFNPVAVVIGGSLNLYSYFSHCGADLKGGWLNYVFNTPEVHRWHHSAQFPDDPKFRYGCNYGVGVTFWDLLFGTFYLPRDERGQVLSPSRMGHPEGYPDEPNYLKMLFGARAFPALQRWFERDKGVTAAVPAE